MASFTVDVEDDRYNDQKKGNDELHFQDIPHSEEKGKMQTHTFTNFPHSADSDDESGDKTELLRDEKKPPSFWTFEYYQQFFDVDTHQVLSRVLGSMTPRPGGNFLTTKIRPNPDLYGPFWICTTLVFTTAIAGNIANYLQSAGKGYMWKYDFHKVTFAATAIFTYWWLVPAALFAVMWWRNSQSRYTFLELICVYGYSLAIYIPISILWTLPYQWLQWLLVILGAALSGSVLVFTIWPAVRDDNKRIAFGVIGVVLVFHAALAAGFMLYFFHVPSTTSVTPPLNITSSQAVTKQIKDINNPPKLENALNTEKKNLPQGNSPGNYLPLKKDVIPPPGADKVKAKSEGTDQSQQRIQGDQSGTKKQGIDQSLPKKDGEQSVTKKQEADQSQSQKQGDHSADTKRTANPVAPVEKKPLAPLENLLSRNKRKRTPLRKQS